jgi:hypothetical protein
MKSLITKIEVIISATFFLYFLYNRYGTKPFLFVNFWDSLYNMIWKIALIAILIVFIPFCHQYLPSEIFFIGSIIVLFEFVVFSMITINMEKTKVSEYCNSRFIENVVVISIIIMFSCVLIAYKIDK